MSGQLAGTADNRRAVQQLPQGLLGLLPRLYMSVCKTMAFHQGQYFRIILSENYFELGKVCMCGQKMFLIVPLIVAVWGLHTICSATFPVPAIHAVLIFFHLKETFPFLPWPPPWFPFFSLALLLYLLAIIHCNVGL